MGRFLHKSLLLAVSLLMPAALFAQYGYQDLYDSETEAALKEHVSFFCADSLQGRAAGSAGETMAARYVAEKMASYGVEILMENDDFGIQRPGIGDTLVSRNVVGYVQGYDKDLRDHFIVIGARMDGLGTAILRKDGIEEQKIYYGANGNASGLAMLLELSRRFATHGFLCQRSVLFVAFGAGEQGNAGSWYFLNRSFSSGAGEIDAMINLDCLGTGYAGFWGYTCSNADLNAVAATLKGSLQPVFPEMTAQEPFSSDHRSFYAAEIPSVLFTTGRYPEYRSWNDRPEILDYPDMERELEYIYNYAMALVGGPKPVFRPSEEGNKKGVRDAAAVSYYDCDARPTFLGSSSPEYFMTKWVYQYLRYPADCVAEGVQGNVIVDFVIDEKGKVSQVKVVRGVDERLDAEAVRVISASPSWKPGRKNGKKVAVGLSVTVEFRLQKRK